MESISCASLAEEHVALARSSRSGRSARTVVANHGGTLRQTLVALAAGQELAAHESPGNATLQVVTGAVRLTTDSDALDMKAGDLAAIPDERHGVLALEDCAILLTVAMTRQ